MLIHLGKQIKCIPSSIAVIAVAKILLFFTNKDAYIRFSNILDDFLNLLKLSDTRMKIE